MLMHNLLEVLLFQQQNITLTIIKKYLVRVGGAGMLGKTGA